MESMECFSVVQVCAFAKNMCCSALQRPNRSLATAPDPLNLSARSVELQSSSLLRVHHQKQKSFPTKNIQNKINYPKNRGT